MEQRLYEALQRNPIIAAVRDDEGLAQCLRTDIQTVFVLYGDICNIPEIVHQIKDAGKIAIVHADLISGLATKEISVDFLRHSTLADGIISTRANMIQRARELNMIAILRVFLIDSMALDSALSAKNLKPDAIDILPGLMLADKFGLHALEICEGDNDFSGVAIYDVGVCEYRAVGVHYYARADAPYRQASAVFLGFFPYVDFNDAFDEIVKAVVLRPA